MLCAFNKAQLRSLSWLKGLRYAAARPEHCEMWIA